MMFWALFCFFFTLALSMLVVWPLLRHPTLPRIKKLTLTVLVLLLLVPVGLALYSWIGVPAMTVL